MPAKLSLLSDSVSNPDSQQKLLYNTFFNIASESNLIAIPSNLDPQDTRWLFKAFDHYVTNEVDLASELAQAQDQTLAYRKCLEDTSLSNKQQTCMASVDAMSH